MNRSTRQNLHFKKKIIIELESQIEGMPNNINTSWLGCDDFICNIVYSLMS